MVTERWRSGEVKIGCEGGVKGPESIGRLKIRAQGGLEADKDMGGVLEGDESRRDIGSHPRAEHVGNPLVVGSKLASNELVVT